MVENPPVEIKMALQRFRNDYRNSERVAFIILELGSGLKYEKILDAIQTTLKSNGIIGVWADQKQYHPDPYWNIMTYMHGSGMGVCLLEDLEDEGSDQNVAMEVGYMQGLGKEVCLLTDSVLNGFPTPLDRMTHLTFDAHSVDASVRQAILGWLFERGLGSDGVS